MNRHAMPLHPGIGNDRNAASGSSSSRRRRVLDARTFRAGLAHVLLQHGELVIVMLGGGDKSTQKADIRRAIALAKSLQD
jgi:putative component of toxin-antitoxin plasmid stabilization module